jgi:hypothetical protein
LARSGGFETGAVGSLGRPASEYLAACTGLATMRQRDVGGDAEVGDQERTS